MIAVGIVVVGYVVQGPILMFFQYLRSFLEVLVDEAVDLELRLSQSQDERLME